VIPPFQGQHHQDQVAEAVGLTDPWQVQEIRSAQDVRQGRRPKEWICSHGDCAKRYRRLQELKWHITDKHAIPPKFPFCNYTWTRPEKIRSHLNDRHRDHFTEEEQQGICDLRGWKETVGFLLTKGRTTMLRRNNTFRTQSVRLP
jgi:hypothetical protein